MASNKASDNQRKHAVAALVGRFAVAKAEALQQMKQGKKKPLEEDKKESPSINYSASSTSLHLTDASVLNSPNASSKKGNFTFSGYTISQDLEESGPTYSLLPQAIHENLLVSDVKLSSRKGSTVYKVLHELFQNGDSAQKYLQ